jgi:putative DNA primase/helicase
VTATPHRDRKLHVAESKLPFGFELRADGLYCSVKDEDKKGAYKLAWLCAPIEVPAQARDEKSDAWSKLVRFKDLDGNWREWILPDELLVEGFLWLQRLADMGLQYAPDLRAALRRYLHQCNPDRRLISVTRTGWHGESYVLPDQVFGPPLGKDTIFYQADPTLAHSFNQAGTFEEWKEKVAKACCGNSRLLFAVSQAFAAAVQYLLQAESGGINITGPSSIGKTTILIVAGSVWGGGGVQGYKRQWRSTINGLEGLAALHSDAPLLLDEMGEIDGKDLALAAYMLANGQGKSRSRRDGSARPVTTWRSLFLSTGEHTLADKVREDGRRKATAGSYVRVVDIPAAVAAGYGAFENIHGSPTANVFADDLRLRAQKYYGTAIRKFLTELFKDLSTCTDRLRDYRNAYFRELVGGGGTDGQVQRVASRFALIGAGGKLATDFGITGWGPNDASWAMKICFAAWSAKRGYIGPQEVEAGITQVRKFVEAHGESRFTPLSGYGRVEKSSGAVVEFDRPTINRVGFRDNGEYYVLPTSFHEELCAGFDSVVLADELIKRGMLIPGLSKNGNLRRTQLRRISALEKENARVYVLSAKILEGEDS